jgi:hypothetical protein
MCTHNSKEVLLWSDVRNVGPVTVLNMDHKGNSMHVKTVVMFLPWRMTGNGKKYFR